MTVDELKTMKDNECILFVRGIFPFFCNKFKIERHPNYRLLEDFDDKNAYLIGDVKTVRFGEDHFEEELYSEHADDEEIQEDISHTSVTENKGENEQDCYVENIALEKAKYEQPHTAIAARQAKEFSSKPAAIEKDDVLVTAPAEDYTTFVEVADESYLDKYDEDF